MPNESEVSLNSVTLAAAEFVAQTKIGDIPEEALALAERCILDTTGLYVGGLSEESTQILVRMAKSQAGREDCFLLGAPNSNVPLPAAARVLAISAHAHDFDDTQISRDPNHVYGLLTHPSTAPLTAALTTSAYLGNVTGDQFMEAFLCGFEVSCKISEWMDPDHYLRGHHSSGTVATFGAAMAAGKLLGLSPDQLRHALGIAAASAAGIRASFGTMCKPLHVGRAAENGVNAALMAKEGFLSDVNALDGRWGFASVLSSGFDMEKITQGFGQTWSIMEPGVSIKPYPSGILTHQAMDMVLKLVREKDVQPQNVAKIDFYAGDNILNPIRYDIAADALQAKFSMAALISMLVLRRRAGLPEFDDAFVQSEPFQSMQKRVSCHRDPEINAQGFELIRSHVKIELTDGTVLTAQGDTRYRGGPDLPMSQQDIEDKFRACCSFVRVGKDHQDGILAAVGNVRREGPQSLIAQLAEVAV